MRGIRYPESAVSLFCGFCSGSGAAPRGPTRKPSVTQKHPMSASGSRGNPSSAKPRNSQTQLPGHAATIAAALDGDSADPATPNPRLKDERRESHRRKSRDIVEDMLNDVELGLDDPPPPDYYAGDIPRLPSIGDASALLSRTGLARSAVANMNGANEGGSSSSFHSATPGLDVELTAFSGQSRHASNGPASGVVLSPSQLETA